MAQIKGIDVSIWQPNINWVKVKNAGIKFAILRGAYGTYKDTKFDEHIKGAQSQGIDVGVYVYSIASTIAEAEKEAEFILDVIKPYRLTYPVIYDIEDEKQSKLSVKARTDLCISFCEKIENAGYYAMIYANKYWLETKLEYERLKVYDIWLAQWTDEPTWSGNYGIWQTGQQIIDGIGNCDTNISYKNYAEIIASAKLNNLAENNTPVVTPPQKEETVNIPPNASSGLGSIALKTKVSIKSGSVWGGLTSARGQAISISPEYIYDVVQIGIHHGVTEALLQPINSWVAVSSLINRTSTISKPLPVKALAVGSKVRYKGYVQYSSWGTGGKPIYVDGTFTVRQLIKGRAYGVLIDQLGWISEKDAKLA